jgi:hypothetical protein
MNFHFELDMNYDWKKGAAETESAIQYKSSHITKNNEIIENKWAERIQWKLN